MFVVCLVGGWEGGMERGRVVNMQNITQDSFRVFLYKRYSKTKKSGNIYSSWQKLKGSAFLGFFYFIFIFFAFSCFFFFFFIII